MVQKTSYDAYAEMVCSGSIQNRQRTILLLLRRAKRPVTNREIAHKLQWEINRVTPRVLELREMGLVEQAGDRVDDTGRTAMCWRLTK